MYGECKGSKEKKISVLSDADTSVSSFYYKWTKQKQTCASSSGSDMEVMVTTKVKTSATVSEMVKELIESLPDFIKHVYRVHHQYEFIRTLKDTHGFVQGSRVGTT